MGWNFQRNKILKKVINHLVLVTQMAQFCDLQTFLPLKESNKNVKQRDRFLEVLRLWLLLTIKTISFSTQHRICAMPCSSGVSVSSCTSISSYWWMQVLHNFTFAFFTCNPSKLSSTVWKFMIIRLKFANQCLLRTLWELHALLANWNSVATYYVALCTQLSLLLA